MVMDVQINVCTIILTNKRHLENWMQIIWGLFSVGGIIGPLIVYIFGSNTYIVVGIISLLLSFSYKFLESPETIIN